LEKAEQALLLQRHAEGILRAFSARDIVELKRIGADAAEEAFSFNSPCLVDVSIVAYSFSKFLEKHYILESPLWREFEPQVREELSRAIDFLRVRSTVQACGIFRRCIMEIEELSRQLGRFSVDVVAKARIKAATQIYAHGASLGKAAALTGADKRELSKYIGVTRMPEKYSTLSVSQRLEAAKKVFS
jgi:hypothetical protein